MKLESMYKQLKYFYLSSKKVHRLDKGLCTLYKFIRDKNVDHIIKTVKMKNSKHMQNIHLRLLIPVLKSKYLKMKMKTDIFW